MRVCSGPGCLRAVRDTVRFCDECKPIPTTIAPADVMSGIKDHTSGYDAEMDALRKGTRWQGNGSASRSSSGTRYVVAAIYP
jgi:hypothetical protein